MLQYMDTFFFGTVKLGESSETLTRTLLIDELGGLLLLRELGQLLLHTQYQLYMKLYCCSEVIFAMLDNRDSTSSNQLEQTTTINNR